MVTCRGIREVKLTDFDGGGLNHWKSHPVLSQFSSRKASLKITIGDRTVAECAGLMIEAHQRAVDDWIDFDRFVPAKTWTHGDGKPILINGPEFLLREYRSRLHLRLSLLHFGSSFVVADSFKSTQEERPTRPRSGRFPRRASRAP